MSLRRLIYYSAITAGWAAMLGWLVSEMLRSHWRLHSLWLLAVVTAGSTARPSAWG